MAKPNNTFPEFTEQDKLGFWSGVNILGPDDCWHWKGKPSKYGYGKLILHRRNYRAHKLAFHLSGRLIPDELFVLHKCDHRLCCNPNHLFSGDHDTNMKDMCAKERQAKGDKSAYTMNPDRYSGENHWIRRPGAKKKGKFKEDDILNIRWLRNIQGVERNVVARLYETSRAAIYGICKYRTYKHIL